MKTLNRVMLIGIVTNKPQVLSLSTQTPCVTLLLSTYSFYKEHETRTTTPQKESHQIILYGHLADFTARFLSEGSYVYVDGKLRAQSNGVDIIAQDLLLLGEGLCPQPSLDISLYGKMSVWPNYRESL